MIVDGNLNKSLCSRYRWKILDGWLKTEDGIRRPGVEENPKEAM